MIRNAEVHNQTMVAKSIVMALCQTAGYKVDQKVVNSTLYKPKSPSPIK